MKFFQKISNHQIFEKVAQLASPAQLKQKFKSKLQSIAPSFAKNPPPRQPIIQQPQLNQHQTSPNHANHLQQPTYHQAEEFMLSLHTHSQHLLRQQLQKRTKKQIFSQLQIEPIYMQTLNNHQLFRMELEFREQVGGYERTEQLHEYLKQVDSTIRKVLREGEGKGNGEGEGNVVEGVVQVVERYLDRVTRVLKRIALLRQRLHTQYTQQALKITSLVAQRQILQQKLSLLSSMKQKQQLCLIHPTNLQQIYYTQRSRHKLYSKITSMKIVNSYFSKLKKQIVKISQSNIRVMEGVLGRWVNGNNQGDKEIMKEKNVEKLLICLYFVKNQNIYKDNGLDASFQKVDRKRFVQEVEKVKLWKNYKYVRDPAMKDKITEFLNLLIQEISAST